ncbi:MAG: AMP-binding protein [Planctomycetota bacterium]
MSPRTPAPARRCFDLRAFPSLGHALDEASFRCRSNPFLIETDRGEVVSELDFRALRAEAARCAELLRRHGAAPGARLALLLANGPRWIVAAYAGLLLGCVLVPLDARAEPEGQAALLAHSRARLLVTDGPVWRRLAAKVPAGALDLALVNRPLPGSGREASAAAPCPVASWEEALPPDAPPLEPCAARGREDPAAIVYSSGTSGRPKGCVLSHESYLSQLETLANTFPLEEDDVYLSVLPSNHALDFMCGFLVPLLCGARVVHLRTLRPEWIVQALVDQRVTHLSAVPALLLALERRIRERLDALERLPAAGLRGFTKLNAWLTEGRPRPWLSRALLRPVHQALGGRLKTIFAGGAPVPAEVARRLYELGIPVAIGYGLTEACAVVSVNTLDPFRADTVGPPLPGLEVRLADRDAAGRGEVLVRGASVFQGYLDDEELTREALRDGWLHTGDLGELDATGHLRLVGRKKHMVVTAGGKNVYPEDVERRFEGVACEELAVLASQQVWSARPGEDEALILALRPRAGDAPDAILVELAARNRALPAYQRLVGALVVERAFPRTTSLKLKRDDLARDLAVHPRDALRPL